MVRGVTKPCLCGHPADCHPSSGPTYAYAVVLPPAGDCLLCDCRGYVKAEKPKRPDPDRDKAEAALSPVLCENAAGEPMTEDDLPF